MSARFIVTQLLKVAPVFATRLVVRKFARTTLPRPRRWSMARPYTSWLGLTDARYTGRHLGEDPHWDARAQNGPWPGVKPGDTHIDTAHRRSAAKYGPRLNPRDPADYKKLKRLFLRDGRPQQDCQRTSVLFLFFAQWFTDAFLRTDFRDHRRTDSNHEIDFCALYGLTEEKTNLLRFPLYNKATGKRVLDINNIPQVDPERAHLMAYEVVNGEQFPPKLYQKVPDGQGGEVLRYAKDVTYEVEIPQEGSGANPAAHTTKTVTRYLHSLEHMDRITINQPITVVEDYFAMGLEHGNGTLGYVALNILMLRAHNKIAEEILAAHGADWKAAEDPNNPEGWGNHKERVFQVTRAVLTFILLKIVVEDYVGHISDWKLKTPIGMSEGSMWGKSNRIAIEFNLLYRWHSLVPDTIFVDGSALTPDDFRRKPALVKEHGLRKLLTEFSSQRAGRMGLRNYPDFFASGRDPSMPSTLENTLRVAYDSKLQPMNRYRNHFGLKPYSTFEELVGDQPDAEILIKELKAIYGHIDDVEWFIGMLAEKHSDPVIMGDLMMYMVANDAFTQALNNPLLSKRLHDPRTGGASPTFSRKGLEIIGKISSLQDLSDYVLGDYEARCSFSY